MTVKGQVDTTIQCYFNAEKPKSYNKDYIFPILSLMFIVYLNAVTGINSYAQEVSL
jgi:hypothetical protein